MKIRLKPIVLALTGLSVFASLSSAQVVMFDLEFVPHAGVITSATGSGTAQLDTATNELSWNFSFADLTSGLTNAHFHGPATSEQNGGVLVGIPFTSGVTSGTLAGSATVSDTIEGYLLDHMTYVNLHTSNNGVGEIRAQVVPEPGTYALFAGMAALGGVFFWRRRVRR